MNLQIGSPNLAGFFFRESVGHALRVGLSSVLDLTDKSMESQRSLFTEEEWK
ncbi:hypothetical protein BDC45DRAFT_452160 [Circinella umbellata]|nr:hypothetical protein BDC45DRAFT_452160 [Circinella umbellata]